MELKEYQTTALDKVKRYLVSLDKFREQRDALRVDHPEAARSIDFPLSAWEEVRGGHHHTRKTGDGQFLPHFCLKIPTGGGKTLLAVKSIDLINTHYKKSNCGLVLWVVPTTQIYRQTIGKLRDRSHPYRQHLDNASGGRTQIIEKMDRFSPADVAENLVVLFLMLQSSARQNKETLRLFRDRSGFGAFFPAEDDPDAHEELLKRFPNLDTFSDSMGFFGKQIKTSLGNTLRLLRPVVILDEAHKAYSENAQSTIDGFNPSLLVELSATSLRKFSNELVSVRGAELAREEMIKLDLHVSLRAQSSWKETLLASIERRNALESLANDHESESGDHIRPICLIQVERTGTDQRKARFIHAEDVREYLVNAKGISADRVAIKSSVKDDIEGIDLLSRDCPIRYIITKSALQEGWDCSFAYVLTILTNPGSKTSLTQLIGRVLRQPYARKSRVRELDESYVYCTSSRGKSLLDEIRRSFEYEGLGDLQGRIMTDDDSDKSEGVRIATYRDKFSHQKGNIFLPVFVIKSSGRWQKVNYILDIESRIDWSQANFTSLAKAALQKNVNKDTEFSIGLSDDVKELVKSKRFDRSHGVTNPIDVPFLCRHLVDVIPNPWQAHQIITGVFDLLVEKHGVARVTENQNLILERIRNQAECEKDRLAEHLFSDLLDIGSLRLMLLKNDERARIPNEIRSPKSSYPLRGKDNDDLQRSLFDKLPENDFNQLEKEIAWFLDDQERLFWWHRNRAKLDYSIQGWRSQKVYPDMIYSRVSPNDSLEYDRIYIVEPKGEHLKDNDRSKFIDRLFGFCNRLAKETTWSEFNTQHPLKGFSFKLLPEDEWKDKVLKLFDA